MHGVTYANVEVAHMPIYKMLDRSPEHHTKRKPNETGTYLTA